MDIMCVGRGWGKYVLERYEKERKKETMNSVLEQVGKNGGWTGVVTQDTAYGRESHLLEVLAPLLNTPFNPTRYGENVLIRAGLRQQIH